MKKLYVPWRSKYTKSVIQYDENSSQDMCVFCQQNKGGEDEKYFILRRFNHIIACINLYPYNPGHILLISKEHVAFIEELTDQARGELITVASHSSTILKKAMNCHGINIGINMGKDAGAGIPHHFHMHVLPRWRGDTNFLPVLADTKVISEDLANTYALIKPEFDAIIVS